jgi:glycosyltransferase involved in cell wall biosynthesis
MRAPRVLVHDYAGHVGQVAVSRELARRGFEVLHLYAAGIETPRGALERRPGDPANFAIQPVHFTTCFHKHSYVLRQMQEIRYGKPLVRAMRAFAPDIVLSANTPLFPQAALQRACRRGGLPFLFWMTDIYSLAVAGGLRGKLGPLGPLIAGFYHRLERTLLAKADGVVVIAEGFRDILCRWGIARGDVRVIPVCAPVDEITPGPKDNAWSRAQGIATTRNIVYSGTLGTKHNPRLIAALARHFADQPAVRIVVISQGVGADYLKARKQAGNLNNLLLLPFQPYDRMSEVLASADVLLAILEPQAATYSLPSKVLSQLCAGRAQVVAVPAGNAVAHLVTEAEAGIVISPDDETGFVRAVDKWRNDEVGRARMGASGRAHAERALAVGALGDAYQDAIITTLAQTGVLSDAMGDTRPVMAPERHVFE